MSEQTNTPRTDEAELDNADFTDWGAGPSGYCRTDFARTLERELSAAQKRVQELKAIVRKYLASADAPMGFATIADIDDEARAALKEE